MLPSHKALNPMQPASMLILLALWIDLVTHVAVLGVLDRVDVVVGVVTAGGHIDAMMTTCARSEFGI
jgi:hypothetical protein